MKLLEINQYSRSYYSPKSKSDLRGDEAKKYRKRLCFGKGLIDVDSIATVEPEGTYDEETLEYTCSIYCIYFKNTDTRVCTDIEGYNMIKEYYDNVLDDINL